MHFCISILPLFLIPVKRIRKKNNNQSFPWRKKKETPAGRLEDWDGGFEISYEGFEIIYTQPVSPSDEEWVDEDYTYYPKDTVTDKDGNVLCEYVRRNESVWVTEYSFDESADGLPIFVTTREAHRAVANVVECIAIALGILAAADVLLAIVIYIKKAKKYA